MGFEWDDPSPPSPLLALVLAPLDAIFNLSNPRHWQHDKEKINLNNLTKNGIYNKANK